MSSLVDNCLCNPGISLPYKTPKIINISHKDLFKNQWTQIDFAFL